MSPVDLVSVRLATDATLAVLLEGSLLLGATWGVVALLRRHAPAVRHTVWTVGFVLALVVPLAGTLLPVRSLGVVQVPRTPTAAPTTDGSTHGSTAPGLDAAAPFPGLPEFAGTTRPTGGVGAPGSPPEIPALERIGAGLATGFLVLWALGGLILLARLAWHRVHVGRLTRRGSAVPPGDAPARVARREAARMGIRRRVRVIYTSELAVPVTWGVLRPVLLLPPDAVRWSDTRLRAVTVHELAHVRRWDALSQQLAELARALYWANPLVWAARRCAAGERESACDREVVRLGMPPSDYAAVLVEMARRGAGAPPGLRPEFEGGLAMAGPSRLEARVSAILEDGGGAGRRPPGRRAALAACFGLAVVGAPLAGISLVAEGSETETAAADGALSMRVQTVRALGMECDELSLWTLTRALQDDPAPAVRHAAARALARHDDPRAVRVLAHAAGDARQDPSVRRGAVHALGLRNTPDAARALVARLHDGDPTVRRSAVRALGRMELEGRRWGRYLAMAMLKDTDPAVRAAAAEALQGVRCNDARRWLGKALADPSPAVTRAAERALERRGGG